MLSYFLSLAILFSASSFDPRGVIAPSPIQAVTTTDGDIITGVSLPRFGTLCEEAEVRGGPDAAIYKPLYVLPAGERVRLREQSNPTGEWVMIEPAKWIPLKAVCDV